LLVISSSGAMGGESGLLGGGAMGKQNEKEHDLRYQRRIQKLKQVGLCRTVGKVRGFRFTQVKKKQKKAS